MKIKREQLDYVTLGFFIVLILAFFTGIFSSQVGYTLVVIDNPDPNSMWPTYFQGDLFLIDKVDAQDIHIGDVVVYQKSSSEVKVIHRVIDIIIHNNEYYFRVKGDNFVTNQTPDTPGGTTLIPYSEIVGKTILRLPYLGHLSLSMQRNTGVQILVYFVAGAAAIAILLWPNDEDEEKDEYVEVTKNSMILWSKGILNKPKSVFQSFKSSKHRILIFIACLIFMLLLVLPIFIGGMISTSQEYDKIQVIGVTPGTFELLPDTIGGTNYTADFMQLEVELVDNSGMWKRIKSFDLEIFSDSAHQDRLSYTRWNSFKDFKGRVIIGASIVIPHILSPANGSVVYVKITLDIVTAFFFHSKEPFEDSFQYRV